MSNEAKNPADEKKEEAYRDRMLREAAEAADEAMWRQHERAAVARRNSGWRD